MPKSKVLPSFVAIRRLIALRCLAPFRFSLTGGAVAALLVLSGCAATREVSIDYPETEPLKLHALPGTAMVQGDDFYIQLISEFEFARDANRRKRCRDLGVSYKTGEASAALLFQI